MSVSLLLLTFSQGSVYVASGEMRLLVGGKVLQAQCMTYRGRGGPRPGSGTLWGRCSGSSHGCSHRFGCIGTGAFHLCIHRYLEKSGVKDKFKNTKPYASSADASFIMPVLGTPHERRPDIFVIPTRSP